MFSNTFLKNRLFIAMALCICSFILAYSWPLFFRTGQIFLLLIFLVTFSEWYILYRISGQVTSHRTVGRKLSLGDLQQVQYHIISHSHLRLSVEISDELPYQLQIRDFKFTATLPAKGDLTYSLQIHPLIRGIYQFGQLHLFISLPWISLVERRISLPLEEEIMVIPSVIQMKKYELEVFSRTASLSGIRRIRTLDEDDEFEHIRSYQQGDNIRSINWKATSKKNHLMINQFQNTRSQMVYCIIDKGRSMKMPFHGLTLLDYAINTSLVISNIVLKKFDKAGLVTFNDKMGKIVAAENNHRQLSLITQYLYDQRTGFKESNYELLFYSVQNHIKRRSILFFFTNFEHLYDLERNLEYFKALNRRHLIVLIFFVNTELIETSEIKPDTISDIYLKTFAERTLIEKEIILNKLKYYGIQCILTKPENLSVEVINKYLEIKARRIR